jgi:DNA-binding MarR family transcriptional regulator
MDALFTALEPDLNRRILRELADHPRLRHKDLVERLGGHKSAITKSIKPLEEVGLVERVPSADGHVYEVVDGVAVKELLRHATNLWAGTTAALVRRAKREAAEAARAAEHFDTQTQQGGEDGDDNL